MKDADTVDIRDPDLLRLSAEDIKAVRSSFPGKFIGRCTVLVGLIVVFVGALASLDAKLTQFLAAILPNEPLLRYGLMGVPVIAILAHMFREWWADRRRRALQALAVRVGVEASGYFRIGPYLNTPEDRLKFGRADRAHETVLDWIEQSTHLLLYLTGDSGSGKTSLLSAFVLPELRERGWTVIEARAWQDPLAALHNAISGSPGRLRTRSKENPDLSSHIAAAARRARGRLLLVLDQFEEFVILANPDQHRGFAAFVKELQQNSSSDVRLLLILRSDYQMFLEDIGLSPLRLGENFYQVARFRHAAATNFMQGSGLALQPDSLDTLLTSASELDETPGLVRPITLNVVGYILAEGRGVAPSMDAARLVRDYINQTVEQPVIRPFADRILEQLITDQSTKRPRSEDELVAATGFRPAEVHAVLNGLGIAALARPLDRAQGIWELSHDFVARAVARYLGRPRRDLLRRSGAYLAPALLLSLLATGIGAVSWNHSGVGLPSLKPDRDFSTKSFQALDERLVYAIKSDGTLWREMGGQDHRQIAESVAQFQAVNDGLVYVLQNDGALWRQPGDPHDRSRVDDNVIQFQAIGSDLVYVLRRNGTTWRENFHDRKLVAEHAVHFQAVNEALIFVLDSTGGLWRELNNGRERDKVADDVANFQVTDDTDLYTLVRGTEDLWHEELSRRSRERGWVDGNVWDFQVISTHVVYVLGTDRKLWCEPGMMDSRGRVADHVVQFQAVNEGLVYVLATDGTLWRVRRDKCSSDLRTGRPPDEVDDNVSLHGVRIAR